MYPKELVDAELFKVFNENENHHGFQYREGVNHLKEPFAEEGSCVPGGFYFTTKEHISDFLQFGVRVRRVHVPFDHPECRVVEDPAGDKYRANMLMLGEKCTVEELLSMVPLRKLLQWANSTGQPDVFDHWKDLGSPGISEITMDDASAWGLTEVLEWWKNSGLECKWSVDAMHLASQYGHVHVLEWWKNSGLECKWNDHAMGVASRNGIVDVLEWWKNSGLECMWNHWAMDEASSNGYIDVLEWWKNSGLECKWTFYGMDEASENGHVAVLEWWKNSGLECKWTETAMLWTSRSRYSHAHILEWWKNSGLECKWKPRKNSGLECRWTSENGHVHVVKHK